MCRSPCCSKDAVLNRGVWTADEDLILSEYIRIHGDGGWGTLPQKAGLKRCGKSCRLRWMNYLHPNIKRGNISTDEDELIIKLHGLLGNRWSLIAGRLPGRTDNEIKNYWNNHLGKNFPNIGSISPQPSKSPSQKKDRCRCKAIPVKTIAMRTVKCLNIPANNDFKFLSDVPQIMNPSKSWSDLLLDEFITDSNVEFTGSNNSIEPNLVDHIFPHFQHSPYYNLASSRFDSTEDLKKMYSDIFEGDMQQVNNCIVCDEQGKDEIYSSMDHVDLVAQYQCLQMSSHDEPDKYW